MKLEDQVCSLELAKKLKELGVKQGSLFWWVEHYVCGRRAWAVFYDKDEDDKVNPHISAFTVAELGLMLPLKIYSIRYYTDWEWRCVDMDEKRSANTQVDSNSEANVRAKMLISLIEKYGFKL